MVDTMVDTFLPIPYCRALQNQSNQLKFLQRCLAKRIIRLYSGRRVEGRSQTRRLPHSCGNYMPRMSEGEGVTDA